MISKRAIRHYCAKHGHQISAAALAVLQEIISDHVRRVNLLVGKRSRILPEDVEAIRRLN